MKYNIFITGKPNSGKSYLAHWLIRGFEQEWAGCETVKTGRCSAGLLYSLRSVPGGEIAPVTALQEEKIVPVTESFDTLGAKALRCAREGQAPIVLLDEIGGAGAESSAFVTELYKTLSSDKTVIAVVKKEPLGDLERLKTVHNGMWIDLDHILPSVARKNLATLLWPEKTLRWGVTLQLFGVNRSFGPEPMRLLQGVERTGLLEKAAQEMGMSFSDAQKMMQEMEVEWGFPIVESSPAGKNCGTRLTEGGAQLLFRYISMQEKVEKAAAEAFAECFDWEQLF